MIRGVAWLALSLMAPGCLDLGDEPWPEVAGSDWGPPPAEAGREGEGEFHVDGEGEGEAAPAPDPAEADGPCPHPGGEPESVGIEMSRNKFWPDEVEICVGDTVVWVNRDTKEHTVYTGDPSDPNGYLQSRRLYFGDSFAHTFDAPGEYVYYCSTHKKKMRDAVVWVRR